MVSLKADPAGKPLMDPWQYLSPSRSGLESGFQFQVSEWLTVTWSCYRLKSQATLKHTSPGCVCSAWLTYMVLTAHSPLIMKGTYRNEQL